MAGVQNPPDARVQLKLFNVSWQAYWEWLGLHHGRFRLEVGQFTQQPTWTLACFDAQYGL